MNNDYICELKIKFDLTTLSEQVDGIKPHQRLVKDSPSLTAMRTQFPFLGSMYNIYVFPPKTGLPAHIDSFRQCAINIPISNTLESITSFYKLQDPANLEHVEHRAYDKVLSNITEVFKFTLACPTLINNKITHSVINNSDNPRVVLSWGLNSDIDFITAKELLNDYIL
jgi:hypothetical protein